MKQEDKELLLLKDLGARLRYHVVISKKVCHKRQLEELSNIGYGQKTDEIYVNGYPIKNCKPYLRSMSSMTEEEREKCRIERGRDLSGECGCESDYLNSIHIDYRGLIPKGLALEAPKGMYA